jgi:8-oxo-dGTP pyrophosphatase MutT (NUDIX family)
VWSSLERIHCGSIATVGRIVDTRRPASGEQLNDGPPTPPRQSAAVILLRDGDTPGAFELLLVQRNPAQRFMGGYWVFPGGAVEAHEGDGDAAHRAAAVRELREEAGVGAVAAGELVRYSRWITPELLRIRFDTHFYLARAPAGTSARCDGHECVDLRWSTASAALEAEQRGELALAFPTLRQLEQLAGFDSVHALLEHARSHPIVPMLPKLVRCGEVARPYLPGEPGYEAG